MSNSAADRHTSRLYLARAVGICLAMLLSVCKSESDDVVGVQIDLKTTRPLQVLEVMKKRAGPHSIVAIDDFASDWVREEDLPKLFALLSSTEKCAPIKLAISSFWPAPSTVGEQAAIMIEGFQAARYPPNLNPGQVNEARKEKLIQWWKDRPN